MRYRRIGKSSRSRRRYRDSARVLYSLDFHSALLSASAPWYSAAREEVTMSIYLRVLSVLACLALPAMSQAAVRIPANHNYSCADLNALWSQTNDGIILIGWNEYHQNREVARQRGACPGGAEVETNFVRSADSGGRASCALGVSCHWVNSVE